MGWIKDVRHEIENLDVSRKNLRKFGIYVGIVFCFVSLWITLKKHLLFLSIVIGISGVLLVLLGVVIPEVLKKVYKIWMSLAFAIGWVVSRVILIVFYFLVITTIGFVSRIFGKKFMETEFNKSKDTYWVKRSGIKNIKYDKMY